MCLELQDQQLIIPHGNHKPKTYNTNKREKFSNITLKILSKDKGTKEERIKKELQSCREPAYCILSAAPSQHDLSGSGIAQLEVYHCQEPPWGTPPVAKVMRKEARHTQRWDRASGVPPEILKHLPPKTRVCLLSALCSHLHLWLYGGLSPTTSLWKKS